MRRAKRNAVSELLRWKASNERKPLVIRGVRQVGKTWLLEAYNSYLIIGGMPERVSSWVNYRDPAKVSQIQRELIEVYENDFSKHNGKVNSGRILMVFRSIVSRLAKPNEKFMYGAVREGGRARDFEAAIKWLVSAGMLNRVYNVSKMEHPLSAFDKLDQFKLFLFDTGFLKHMAGIDNSAILLKSDYQFKGQLTENYLRSFSATARPDAPSDRYMRSQSLSVSRQLQPRPRRPPGLPHRASNALRFPSSFLANLPFP